MENKPAADQDWLVDRVARAIFNDDLNWRKWPQEWRERQYPAARRAIAALEGPVS